MPLPAPDPTEFEPIDLASGRVIYYYNPSQGRMYAVELPDTTTGDPGDVVPKMHEYFTALGFQIYRPQQLSPFARAIGAQSFDSSLPAPTNISREGLQQNVETWQKGQLELGKQTIEGRQKEQIEALKESYGVENARLDAIQRQRALVESNLGRERELDRISAEAADINFARREQPNRFIDAIRFSGQEYWRAKSRATDEQLQDAVRAIQSQGREASAQNTLASLEDQRNQILYERAVEEATRDNQADLDALVMGAR